ncbi:MAG: C4-dicarboxylate ABC transporter [Proteobacteria bacterium]|nr:C4-dicarboxylate ABC transporter [Pseudomonadota bacterium]|tara:strand:- start:3146 stop:4345 length:1200 start_codon:yes stop_codon:yes gene_type:complete
MGEEKKLKTSKNTSQSSRRRFMSKAALAGGATALASLAGCGVGGNNNQQSAPEASGAASGSDLPEVKLKVQAGFPAKDPLFEVAQQIYGYVKDLSGGRMTVELLPAGAVVGALDQADAVHQGVLDGSHAVPAYWYGKNDALSLFGTGPYLGADANTILAWLEYGGGQQLYTEMYNDVLKLDVVPLAYGGMMMQPLGWFRKEVKSADEFKGIKYRTVGLAIDVFKNMGASVVAIPGGEIVPALERGVIDAAEFNNPASDMALGFPDVSKVCMVQSYHQPSEFFEVLLNKRVWDGLPEQYKAIWKIAAKAASAQMSWHTIDLFSKKYVELRDERGVEFIKTPDDILKAQLKAWDKIIEDRGKSNPLFTKIVDSQKDFMKRAVAYQTTFIANPKQAFDHYFG